MSLSKRARGRYARTQRIVEIILWTVIIVAALAALYLAGWLLMWVVG